MKATHTLTNDSNAQIEVRRAGSKVRIFANDAFAKAIDFPTDDDGQLFNADGKLYSNVDAFAEELSLDLTAIAVEEPIEEPENEDEEPIVTDGSFDSIEDLRTQLKAIRRRTQSEELNVKVSLTIRVGKQRVDGKKRWLEEEVELSDAAVDEVRNKWLFLTVNGAPLYAKEVANATFHIDL